MTSFPPPSMMTVVGTGGFFTSSSHSFGMLLVHPSCMEEPWGVRECGVHGRGVGMASSSSTRDLNGTDRSTYIHPLASRCRRHHVTHVPRWRSSRSRGPTTPAATGSPVRVVVSEGMDGSIRMPLCRTRACVCVWLALFRSSQTVEYIHTLEPPANML